MAGGNASRSDQSGLSIRRLYQQAQEGPFAQGLITATRAASDPKNKQGLLHNSQFRDTMVLHGVITDCTALANCYRVQLDRGRAPMPCTFGGLGTNFATGARSITTLQPGTRVVVLWHPRSVFGVILAVIPPAQLRGNKQLAQQITHASRNRVDDVHKQPHRLAGDGHIFDWLAGRPYDATNIGEQGWMAETGMRAFVDPFMSMFGLDEASSLQVFYHDQLVRLAAFNYKHFTAGIEHESLEDQGEHTCFTGYTPYPWEQMSKYERGNSTKELAPDAWQISTPWYGPVEPTEDKMRPWHREYEFHGYLGQGFSHFVQTKPTSGDKAMYTPGEKQPVYPGLYKQHVGLDGTLTVQSAKRISITKQIAVLTPARAYVAEQTEKNKEGDNPENYKFAGHPAQGDGPPHKITGEVLAEASNKDMQRACGVLDLHAYLYNYATIHPFFFHEKDWTIKNEGELEHTGGKVIAPIPFSKLATEMFLKTEDFAAPKKIKIDHRDKYVEGPEYFPTKSGFELLEDGGVVIYDGFGSELRMTGGHVYLSAPGDIWFKSGRNLVAWGGDDVDIRARNSMDLTVTEKDIRIKAEKNIQILAGNGKDEGGVLIESRAETERYDFSKNGEDVKSAGIMLRAPKTAVIAWSRDVYLRTGTNGEDGLDGGDIVLDAGRGRSKIITHADSQEHHTATAIAWNWGIDGDIKATDRISQSVHDWCSPTFIDGGLILSQGICSKGGHLSTEGAFVSIVNPFVVEPDSESISKCEDAVEEGQNRVKEQYPSLYKQLFIATLEQQAYAEEKKGNDTVIKDSKVSLRTPEQYGTETGWELYEDRWQQMSRITGESTTPWKEKPVESKNENTMPYPGRKNYEEEQLFQTQDLDIYDVAGGNPKPRGEQPELQPPYDDPKYKAPTPKSLQEYPVIDRK